MIGGEKRKQPNKQRAQTEREKDLDKWVALRGRADKQQARQKQFLSLHLHFNVKVKFL